MIALALALAASQTPGPVWWSDDSHFVRFEFREAETSTTWIVHTVIVDAWTGKIDDEKVGESNCVFGDADKADQLAVQCQAARKKHDVDGKKADDAWVKAHAATATKWDGTSTKGVHVAIDASSAKFSVGKHGKDFDDAVDEHGMIGAAVSPDGQWVLCFAQADQGEPHFALLAGVAWVDLLDAGAGDLKAAADALGKIGFAPARKSKAQSPHAKTEVFYAVGFDDDAKQVAAAVGGEAKPLTWSTPFALTVAVAK